MPLFPSLGLRFQGHYLRQKALVGAAKSFAGWMPDEQRASDSDSATLATDTAPCKASSETAPFVDLKDDKKGQRSLVFPGRL